MFVPSGHGAVSETSFTRATAPPSCHAAARPVVRCAADGPMSSEASSLLSPIPVEHHHEARCEHERNAIWDRDRAGHREHRDLHADAPQDLASD